MFVITDLGLWWFHPGQQPQVTVSFGFGLSLELDNAQGTSIPMGMFPLEHRRSVTVWVCVSNVYSAVLTPWQNDKVVIQVGGKVGRCPKLMYPCKLVVCSDVHDPRLCPSCNYVASSVA